MSVSIFAPFSTQECGHSIELKPLGGVWTLYSLDTAVFAGLPDALEMLGAALHADGYRLSLTRTSSLAGFMVHLSHIATPFAMRFSSSDGLHALLGFESDSQQPERLSWSSVQAPMGALDLPGLGHCERARALFQTTQSIALNSRSQSAGMGARRLSRLRLHALSPTQVSTLQTILLLSLTNERPIRIAEDWTSNEESLPCTRMPRAWPALSYQTQVEAKRLWPAPQPAFYDIDLYLES